MKPTLNADLLDEKTRFRVQIKHAVAIGPGKADVLQAIAPRPARWPKLAAVGMSYQSLVTAMNGDFVEALVLKQRGRAAGGGARLTETGARVLAIYRAMERDAQRAVAKQLPQLLALIRAEAGMSTAAAPKRSRRPAARDLGSTP